MSTKSYFIHVDDKITEACSQILTSDKKNVLTLKHKDSPECFNSIFNKTNHIGNLTLKIKNESVTCKMLTKNSVPLILVDLDLDKRIILKKEDLNFILP